MLRPATLPELADVYLAFFSKVCTIKADVRHIWDTTCVKKKFGSLGSYYRLNYTFILIFSDVELKAQFAWIEDVSVCSQWYINFSHQEYAPGY
jgi:hypothetical protein